MSEEIKPLSPEEVDALELSSEGCTHQNFYRLIATVRDRERQQDLGNAAIIGKAAAEHRLAEVCKERDELQRQLAEARQRIVSKFGGMGPGSTIWGNTQWDKGYAAAITAVLADFDAAREGK